MYLCIMYWAGQEVHSNVTENPNQLFGQCSVLDTVPFLTDDLESLPQTVLLSVRVDVLVCERKEGREQYHCKEKGQVGRGKCSFAERLLGFLKIKSYRIFLF